MHNVAFMEIFECFSDSFEELLCFLFLESMLWFGEKIVVERVGASIFLDQKDFVGSFYSVYESCNYWMAEFGKNVYLSLQIF